MSRPAEKAGAAAAPPARPTLVTGPGDSCAAGARATPPSASEQKSGGGDFGTHGKIPFAFSCSVIRRCAFFQPICCACPSLTLRPRRETVNKPHPACHHVDSVPLQRPGGETSWIIWSVNAVGSRYPLTSKLAEKRALNVAQSLRPAGSYTVRTGVPAGWGTPQRSMIDCPHPQSGREDASGPAGHVTHLSVAFASRRGSTCGLRQGSATATEVEPPQAAVPTGRTGCTRRSQTLRRAHRNPSPRCASSPAGLRWRPDDGASRGRRIPRPPPFR